MPLLDDLDSDLQKQINLISAEFVARYFPAKPEEGPDVYHQHVKAFCILAHAAFEEFVEQVSLELMSFAIRAWYERKVISRPLLSLLLFYKATISFSDNEDADQLRNFDVVRAEIEAVKQRHSNAIFENHGFSLKYLRSILTPVAIDISSDPTFTSSLRTLSDARGSYAHTFCGLGSFYG